MSKELHIALQNTIGDLGTDVLKSPFLVNILQDYGAFDVHNKDAEKIKQRLSELVSKGQMGETLSWKGLKQEKVEKKAQKLLTQYNNDISVRYIINAVLLSLEKQPLPEFHAPSPTIQADTIISVPEIWVTKIDDFYKRADGVSFSEIRYVGDSLANGQESLLRELKYSISDESQQKLVVQRILKKSLSVSNSLYWKASSFHRGLDSRGKRQYGDRFLQASAAAINVSYKIGDFLEEKFNGKYSGESVSAWKNGIELHTKLAPYLADISLNISTISKYSAKIHTYDTKYKSPKYETTPSSSIDDVGGCGTIILVFVIVIVLGLLVGLVNGDFN